MQLESDVCLCYSSNKSEVIVSDLCFWLSKVSPTEQNQITSYQFYLYSPKSESHSPRGLYNLNGERHPPFAWGKACCIEKKKPFTGEKVEGYLVMNCRGGTDMQLMSHVQNRAANWSVKCGSRGTDWDVGKEKPWAAVLSWSSPWILFWSGLHPLQMVIWLSLLVWNISNINRWKNFFKLALIPVEMTGPLW